MHVMSTKNDIFVQSICGGHADGNGATHAPLFLRERGMDIQIERPT